MVENDVHWDHSPAIQAHLQITQSIILRMASNSTSCKTWCITLVSAILVIIADKGKPEYVLIATIPTILFLALDSYYLALERRFRESYNSFVKSLHAGCVDEGDLYIISPGGSMLKSFFSSLLSFSVWPFYLTLLVMIWITKAILI